MSDLLLFITDIRYTTGMVHLKLRIRSMNCSCCQMTRECLITLRSMCNFHASVTHRLLLNVNLNLCVILTVIPSTTSSHHRTATSTFAPFRLMLDPLSSQRSVQTPPAPPYQILELIHNQTRVAVKLDSKDH